MTDLKNVFEAMTTVNHNQQSMRTLLDLLAGGKNIKQEQINCALVANQLATTKALQEMQTALCSLADDMKKSDDGSTWHMMNEIFGGRR